MLSLGLHGLAGSLHLSHHAFLSLSLTSALLPLLFAAAIGMLL